MLWPDILASDHAQQDGRLLLTSDIGSQSRVSPVYRCQECLEEFPADPDRYDNNDSEDCGGTWKVLEFS